MKPRQLKGNVASLQNFSSEEGGREREQILTSKHPKELPVMKKKLGAPTPTGIHQKPTKQHPTSPDHVNVRLATPSTPTLPVM